MYTFITGNEIERVGFIRNDNGTSRGCSPDSIVGNCGMLEIKTMLPHLLADLILNYGEYPPEHVARKFPTEHIAQCQGALWTAEREWIDLAIYWPKMPLYRVRSYRDEIYIKTLEREVSAFNLNLDEMTEKLRKVGGL